MAWLHYCFTCIERHRRFQLGVTAGIIIALLLEYLGVPNIVTITIAAAVNIVWLWEV